MTKKRGNNGGNGKGQHGNAKAAFKKVARWRDELPKVQLLPRDLDQDQFLDDVIQAQNNPNDPNRLKKATFVKIAKKFLADAKRIDPILRDIALFIKGEADIDINQARDDRILSVLGKDRRHQNYGIPKTRIVKGPDKEQDRLIKKSLDENDGNFDDIKDVARYAIEGETADEVAALCIVMKWLKESKFVLPGGARVLSFTNRFIRSTGSRYRSGIATIFIPDPEDEKGYVIAEIQIRHKGFERDIEMGRKSKQMSRETYKRIRAYEERYADGAWPEDILKKYKHEHAMSAKIHDGATKQNDIDLDAMLLLIKIFQGVRLRALQTIDARMSIDYG